jgi:predicted PurR-regulated permease PerM
MNALIAQTHAMVGLPPPPPTIQLLLERVDAASWLAQTAGSLQSIMADAVFILIYLGFIFGASAAMSQKLDRIFPVPKRRDRARRVISRIKASMEMYLWTQTIISLGISGLTLATLQILGLENALFWSLIIFFLNYIPTLGSILATVLPTLVAIVQFDQVWQIAAVALGTGFWQFSIGNFIQPRLMGDSLNLSALVVLLSLALWGSVWGIAGAFLAAPLTVAMMIVLAQFPSTRWLAILLSADGRPERGGSDKKKRRLFKAQPSL